MIYTTFLEDVRQSVQEKLGPDYHVGLHQVLKNNGLLLDGLSILAQDATLAPTIYLNSYYDEAENGLSLPSIAEQIILLYEEQDSCSPELSEQLECFNDIKDKVAYKLIGTADNRALLADAPHYPFLDLAIVFYLMIADNEDGQMTALIQNRHLEHWNITSENLLELAEKNTPKLFPARIIPIEHALAEAGIHKETQELFLEQPPIFLSVLTNQKGINGASCLLYKDIIKNFAELAEDDVVILPSSIHEVLLTPSKKAFALEELNEMVTLINGSDVPTEDRLSDHVYLYSRERNRIVVPEITPYQEKSSNLFTEKHFH